MSLRSWGLLGRVLTEPLHLPILRQRPALLINHLKEDVMTHTNALILAAALAIPSGAATGDALRTENTLTLDAALDVATATLGRCPKDGYTVTVPVLDRSGRTKVVVHDDGASPHTIENSLRKAYTALTYREPSGAFGKRITANPTGA